VALAALREVDLLREAQDLDGGSGKGKKNKKKKKKKNG
jgi:hypothetical protein